MHQSTPIAHVQKPTCIAVSGNWSCLDNPANSNFLGRHSKRSVLDGGYLIFPVWKSLRLPFILAGDVGVLAGVLAQLLWPTGAVRAENW